MSVSCRLSLKVAQSRIGSLDDLKVAQRLSSRCWRFWYMPVEKAVVCRDAGVSPETEAATPDAGFPTSDEVVVGIAEETFPS